MKYRLVNENFTKNYIKQLVNSYGADASILNNPTEEHLQHPSNFTKIDKAADLFLSVV